MRTRTRYVSGTLLALLAAAAFYVHGVWVGHFLDLTPTSDYCAAKPLAFPATSWTWFPLTHRCRWNDGTTTDLVPWYVNVLVFACLGAAVTFVVLAIRGARRNRTTTREGLGEVT
jgi:hypothetical protein